MRQGVIHQRSMGGQFPLAGRVESQRRHAIKQWIIGRLPGHSLTTWRLFRTGDWRDVLAFLLSNDLGVSFPTRFQLICGFHSISAHVPCEHLQAEMLAFLRAMFLLPTSLHGCIVECGCFKGGGTAKLSLAAKLARRELVVFDSFEGIPENDETHRSNIWGGRVSFLRGDYCGSLEEVQSNVREFGEIEACKFVKGMFQDTLPTFGDPVAAAYLDVDLASSTETCLRYLWPLLAPGGILFSQDGHLPLVLEVLTDEGLWREQVGTAKPTIHGLGKKKLIWMQKLVNTNDQ